MIDAFASAPWYVDHLAPVWLALPEEVRGRFMVKSGVEDRARYRGISPSTPDLAGDDPILVASWGNYRSAAKAGRRQIAEMQHGIGQSYGGDPDSEYAQHPGYPGGTGRQPGSLFLVPNEHAAQRWRDAYGQDVTVAVTGSPRLDMLPLPERTSPPVVAFSFHWGTPSLSMPPELREAFGLYTLAIRHVATAHPVIIHAHPRMVQRVERWARSHGLRFEPEFDEVVRRASLYVADNTSTLYEFAHQGPVVVLNSPRYRRHIPHGLRFDWDTVTNVGLQCDRAFELPAIVEEALADPAPVKAARQRALRAVFKQRRGAARRTADALVKWAGIPLARAA